MSTDPRISSDDLDRWGRRRFLGAALAGAAGVALAGCGLGDSAQPDLRKRPEEEGKWAGELWEPPLEKPEVTFTDLDGNPFPFREKTAGKLALLFFGYTSCPDICPVYLQNLNRGIETIGDGPGSDPMVLFVGVDVARDTPEQMRRYLDRINPSFIGLTGTEKVIASANEQVMQPPIMIEEPDENGDYLVQHGSRAFAFQADDVAHRVYPPDVRADQWVRDLPRLAKGEYR